MGPSGQTQLDVGTPACPGPDAPYPLSPNVASQGQRPANCTDNSCDGIPPGQVNSVTPIAHQTILLPVTVNNSTIVNGAVGGSIVIPANVALVFGQAGNGDPMVGGWFNMGLGQSNLLGGDGAIADQPYWDKWMAISFSIPGRPFFRGLPGTAATDSMVFSPTYAGQPDGPNYPALVAEAISYNFGFNFGSANVGCFKNGTQLSLAPSFGSLVGSHSTNPSRTLPGSAIPMVTAILDGPRSDYRRSVVNVLGPAVAMTLQGDPSQPIQTGPIAQSTGAVTDTLYIPIRCDWFHMLIAPPASSANCAPGVDVAAVAAAVASYNASAKGLPGR
jgi:hypothetical protein